MSTLAPRMSLYALLLAGATAGACSPSGAGAVSLRWRLHDKTTGLVADPRRQPDSDGLGCRCSCGQAACPTTPGWAVGRVRLKIARLDDAGAPAPLQLDPSLVEFPCRQGEATTAFQIPAGTLVISVEGFDPTSGAIQATGPPGIVRPVREAQVANLDVVELAVDPLPLFAGGSDDLGAVAPSDMAGGACR